ncbi:adenosylcobinamide-GDP ribazoletransferase [Thermomonospora cellulosilytica]|uniref:Adenosylcobinamide-GDP ribazoletransferase n=1 Tax=Thermomonospora cellulosilytica TaxID=1411118 RepID=A0A7W3N373_9ACTN|nr:adenosylcobinamide-GDP ribazoletransferase [Thermomonospora cellulosilytica]MBA9006695.1 adenosylcobinamide-GDP ribazoletransferase [Thermomonospora cellulosilytica]
MTDGIRLAFGLLTVLPVRNDRVDRDTARRAMLAAPAVGLVVGGAAALVMVAADRLGLGGLTRAVLAVAVPAVLTRALHLDGLADLADGLGSGRPAEEALAVMKRSDIGPFGVVTLLLVVMAQAAALAEAPEGAYAVVLAAVTGRLAFPWACRAGVPAARPEGLGALVAGTVPAGGAAAVTVIVLVLATGCGALAGGLHGLVTSALAVVCGVGAALALLRHAVRRLGGVTGDVLGALAEIAALAALLVLAVR